MEHLGPLMASRVYSHTVLSDSDDTDIETEASIAQTKHDPVQRTNGAPKGYAPSLFHKVNIQTSILALAVSKSCIYAGTQNGQILVWSSDTYEQRTTIAAHHGSVLCLHLSANGRLLFSSAGDAIVNVWCTEKLVRLYSIYSRYDVGDVFCVRYCESLQTVFLGAQNTSIQVKLLLPSRFPSANGVSGTISARRIADWPPTPLYIHCTEIIGFSIPQAQEAFQIPVRRRSQTVKMVKNLRLAVKI